MRALDALIREQMPASARHLYEGRFWGGTEQRIVGYGVMDYRNRSGEEVQWFVVGLAAQKNHTSIYVNAVENDTYILAQYKGRLGRVKTGSAAISLQSLDDVDLDNLSDLLKRAAELSV